MRKRIFKVIASNSTSFNTDLPTARENIRRNLGEKDAKAWPEAKKEIEEWGKGIEKDEDSKTFTIGSATVIIQTFIKERYPETRTVNVATQ